jgi:uncharacterized membrane protein
MPDQEPIPPPASSPGPELGPKSTSTGLPSNVAAALACIPLIGGIIFYVLEKRDTFVRFYAMQSIILGIAWILLMIACGILAGVFGSIPKIGDDLRNVWGFLAQLIHLAVFVIMVITMVKAFTGVRWEIPYIGPMARRQEGTV